MSKAPWFKLWAETFLADNYVDAMTAEQIGWYCILLIRSWNASPKCYLSADKQLLAVWCKVADPMLFAQRAKIVLDRFETTADGKYIFHPKLIEQLGTINEVSEKRAVAGQKGGLKSAQAKAKQLLKTTQANASHIEVDIERTTPTSGTDELIFNIAKAYPKLSTIKNEMEIPQAIAALIVAAVHEDGGDKVLAATKAYAASLDHPKFAAKPEDFFGKPYQYRAHIPQPKKPCLGPDEIMERQLRGIYD